MIRVRIPTDERQSIKSMVTYRTMAEQFWIATTNATKKRRMRIRDDKPMLDDAWRQVHPDAPPGDKTPALAAKFEWLEKRGQPYAAPPPPIL
ncbi:MAG: hypothetical protein M3401_17800 [Actinomycetota bacterium]|nr:hypothetical protein [Actinomycetota bacterium]